ncbi:MAG: hypothetical protein H6633_13415 [Anaerolineales bacterium]|nr:hypothetical protein [Anaerolineales bacterium]
MPNYTTVTQKYAQPDVVNFWKALSRTGLQQCEREMVARYFPRQGRLLDIGCGTGRAMLAFKPGRLRGHRHRHQPGHARRRAQPVTRGSIGRSQSAQPALRRCLL